MGIGSSKQCMLNTPSCRCHICPFICSTLQSHLKNQRKHNLLFPLHSLADQLQTLSCVIHWPNKNTFFKTLLKPDTVPNLENSISNSHLRPESQHCFNQCFSLSIFKALPLDSADADLFFQVNSHTQHPVTVYFRLATDPRTWWYIYYPFIFCTTVCMYAVCMSLTHIFVVGWHMMHT